MKFIEGFGDRYTVTPTGEIISAKTGKPLKTWYSNAGYLLVHLNNDSGRYNRSVHRLVAGAYCPKKPNRDIVNHIDGNKVNNNASNLEWTTLSGNSKHAYSMGLMKQKFLKGSELGSSKLNEQDIPIIREMIANDFSLAQIAKKYNVTKGTIWKINKGLNWSHV